MYKVAALLCCHNRRHLTIRAIQSLKAQEGSPSIAIDIYLVDDGSTDGTSASVADEHPEVKLIQGCGGLFWAGGTNRAWRYAAEAKEAYDAFLWMNDDVQLFRSAINELAEAVAVHEVDTQDPFILVGTTVDESGCAITYGGFDLEPHLVVLRRLKRRAPSQCKYERCTTMNGNFVLISRSAFQILGFLDNRFDHSMADIDYGLKATATGVPISLLKNPIGTCNRNEPAATEGIFSSYLSRFKVQKFPLRQWFAFTRRHFGPFFLVSFLLPYLPLPRRLRRKNFN